MKDQHPVWTKKEDLGHRVVVFVGGGRDGRRGRPLCGHGGCGGLHRDVGERGGGGHLLRVVLHPYDLPKKYLEPYYKL